MTVLPKRASLWQSPHKIKIKALLKKWCHNAKRKSVSKETKKDLQLITIKSKVYL